jgi:hypothetical protein
VLKEVLSQGGRIVDAIQIPEKELIQWFGRPGKVNIGRWNVIDVVYAYEQTMSAIIENTKISDTGYYEARVRVVLRGTGKFV